MMIGKRPGWQLPERAATSESIFADRRRLLKILGISAAAIATPVAVLEISRRLSADDDFVAEADPSAGLYPVPRNTAYALDRALTAEDKATRYNNFYEFGSHKSIAAAAQALPLRPWAVVIDGLVEEPITIGIDDLLARMPLEERLYRHRCVEAWAMAVPWSGFALSALLDLARPLAGARYVRFESFFDPDVAPGQNGSWYPWPYIEGLSIAEAANELAFIATGMYGKPLPKQNGAPLRLVVPWKYGFKSSKSLARITLTDERPVTFWQETGPSEYGFWANVNPGVPHSRWSQAMETMLGTGERVPTLLYNGYGDQVASLYAGLDNEPLYM